tara:strand:- start:5784 stop:6428 length:645 start_codon:yes stop_codon:yes gene_type:complete
MIKDKPMKLSINYFLIVLLTGLLISCSRNVDCAVTTFHAQPLPQGEKILVAPKDPSKVGSIEFKAYASMISEQLRSIGYSPVDDNEEAQLIAEVDYDIVASQTKIITTADPYVLYHFNFGRYRYPYYYGRYGIMDPPYHREYTGTVYNRSLTINIVEAEGINTPDRKVIFESSIVSTGREKILNKIMPYLVVAAFTNFPGESGISKIITIEKEQ